MFIATLEASESCHRQLLTLYCPSGCQGDEQTNNDEKILHFAGNSDGHGIALVLY
jgi:hypothetical protein